MDEREGLNEVYPELTAEDKLEPETLVRRIWAVVMAIGYEKDKFIGATHNKIASWGAGFFDYHFGFFSDRFRKYAECERSRSRARFRSYLEKTSDEKPNRD